MIRIPLAARVGARIEPENTEFINALAQIAMVPMRLMNRDGEKFIAVALPKDSGIFQRLGIDTRGCIDVVMDPEGGVALPMHIFLELKNRGMENPSFNTICNVLRLDRGIRGIAGK